MLESQPEQSAKVYLISIKDRALRYEVLQHDTTRNTAILQGREGTFEMEEFTAEALCMRGYELMLEHDLPPLPLPSGRLCGRKRCTGMCPMAMWAECIHRGGRIRVH